MTNKKTCSICGKEKLVSEFYRNEHYHGGLTSHCRQCNNQRMSQQRKRNVAKHTDEWYEKELKSGKTKLCSTCGKDKPITEFFRSRHRVDGFTLKCKKCRVKIHREWTKENRAISNAIARKSMKRRYGKMRLEALQIVSGSVKPKCSNCGCALIELLEINHMYGGGNKERRQRNYKCKPFYADIVNGKRRTDDLDVLCGVCNRAHYIERISPIPIKFDIKFVEVE